MCANVPVCPVRVRRELLDIPTYEPLTPDKNPMFLEKRVYQGSSGKVYPLPVYDRISDQKKSHLWDAIWLENEFIELMVLPEIGGRIHAARDKTNGYDMFYRQNVIKPALVGLTGPWISGGVEFNWPQHHRPATFMPTNAEIERHPDGAITVWCSDHDPMTRMKGMHGVSLHPGKAFIELKVRLYNRTEFVQTYLWWANAATRVHSAYQSFFPPDVGYVADHARRSMSSYPLCQGLYYGIDYKARSVHGVPQDEVPVIYIPPHCGGTGPVAYAPNDLSFYANIPVPTSYMCVGSQRDFFGGYDHLADAGVVHIASHYISPGKKQWTWGNHEFGYAWDRNLTDADERGEYPPYIELMAGVYTDNQPDFSFLMPGETRTWSQYWYPIQKIGPAQEANLDAALSLRIEGTEGILGIAVTSAFAGATIDVRVRGESVASAKHDLSPGSPVIMTFALPDNTKAFEVCTRLIAQDGRVVLFHQPQPRNEAEIPSPATEPPPPAEIASNDELYLTGLHLEQYRHATRDPLLYWREALRRDPGDARCNNAVGLWHLRRGEFVKAEKLFRTAIDRLTRRNANPRDGEPHYNLGLALRHMGRDEEAYAAFYKATWNQQWQSASFLALGELDLRRKDWPKALDHLERSLHVNAEHLNARNLRALALRMLGRNAEADAALAATHALDPLDWWSRRIAGEPLTCDTQTRLDIALDYARAGFLHESIEVLSGAAFARDPGTAPLVDYYLSWLYGQLGEDAAALHHSKLADEATPDYCFPARLEEIAILEAAMRKNPGDGRAPYYLGNLLYDRRRHAEAIALWTLAAEREPNFSVVWRNLGIGLFNIAKDPAKAATAYNNAFRANPGDARLLYERDQLWKRMGVAPKKRLEELEKHIASAMQRHDAVVELCALYNQTGQPLKALAILSTRNFQPWEGGEGLAIGQYVHAHLALGREALADSQPGKACEYFDAALRAPATLNEATHLLANRSDVHYWLGVALNTLGETVQAQRHWTKASAFKGDFQEMSVCAFSETSYYAALSLKRQGQPEAARSLLQALLAYARDLAGSEARIDYFATSLPTMLLFDDDIQLRRLETAEFLEAQAQAGLGRRQEAREKLVSVLARDPNHALAGDFLKQLDQEQLD